MTLRPLTPPAAWFGISFVLHFIWEHVQMPLYGFEPSSWLDGVKMCLFATATGDMLFMAVIYGALALVNDYPQWPRQPAAYRRPATWVLTLLLGALMATSYELWAIYVERRWTYSPDMPLLPVVGVGLSPFLQMLVVPVLTLFACRRLFAHRT